MQNPQARRLQRVFKALKEEGWKRRDAVASDVQMCEATGIWDLLLQHKPGVADQQQVIMVGRWGDQVQPALS